MAKLRAGYLRDAIEAFRREAALAEQGRDAAEDHLELAGTSSKKRKPSTEKLQAVQEGYHEGAPQGGVP